jgi:predicted nucleic acid-binding protein
MFILDSDIVIWILREDPKIIESIHKLTSDVDLAVSALTVTEIYKNIFPSEIVKTETLFDRLRIFDVTREIAKDAGYYWQEYARKLTGLSLADCVIASTTKVNKAILLTLNTRHFPMTDIKVQNPLK